MDFGILGWTLFIVFIVILIVVWHQSWLSTPDGITYTKEVERAKQKVEQKIEDSKIENILALLQKSPDDSSCANRIPSLLDEGKSFHQYNYGTIYNLALEILDSNPDKIYIKTLCLALGRMHYGNLRPDKNPTIYDEQAIQNDILMRSR